MEKSIYKGDLLENHDGDLFQVLDVLFEHEGIYRLLVIDANGKKAIKSSYLFKGFDNV